MTLLGSCAYYNTFYLARKYYFRATAGAPYPTEGGNPTAAGDYNKSIDYSKKLIAQYPKSKLVDDAYLLWARALLGKDDPLETVSLLQDFSTRFPRSQIKPDALFYLGVGYRQAHRYNEAEDALAEFLRLAPRHALAPYAYLERARALMSLERPSEAADAAGQVLDHFPKSDLIDRARTARAEARFAGGAYDLARADYHVMGQRANDDEQRLLFLLREADCLEAAREFPAELTLLRDALSHESEPIPPDTTGGRPAVAPTGPGADHWGRLTLRVGSAHMLAGRLDDALAAFRRVVGDYPRSPLAAEAQYRVGFVYETVADDFDRARAEYGRVKDQAASGPFFTQASQRLADLDRLAQYRNAEGDTLQKRAEAGFLLAELYLFQLNKPERALDQYRKIADTFKGTPWAAKAINAQGWLLSRKLAQPAAAESLFWTVVRQYPATEEQLAARDYLEQAGRTVPDSLIKLPPPKIVPADTARVVAPPRAVPQLLGPQPRGLLAPPSDSLHLGPGRPSGMFPPPGSSQAGANPITAPIDSARAGAFPDTTRHAIAPPDTTPHRPAPGDTTRHAIAPPDTTRRPR